MKLDLPPLHSLRAFEAAARHLNLGQAAGELHVTKGAVSLQIKRLEESLGVTLFDRSARRLALSAAGAAYFDAIHRALLLVQQATLALRAEAVRHPLTVSCTPGFAVQWLLPRLARFEALQPHIDVRIKASNQLSDFARDQVDFAVRHGHGRHPELRVHKLFDDDLVVVAAPAIAQRQAPPRTDEEWRQYVLLHDEHRGDWRLWLEAAGLCAAPAGHGPVFIDSNAVLDAARAGCGLALVPLALVRADLAAMKLVQYFPESLQGRLGYYLAYPEWTLARPEALHLRDWMLGEAGL